MRQTISAASSRRQRARQQSFLPLETACLQNQSFFLALIARNIIDTTIKFKIFFNAEIVVQSKFLAHVTDLFRSSDLRKSLFEPASVIEPELGVSRPQSI